MNSRLTELAQARAAGIDPAHLTDIAREAAQYALADTGEPDAGDIEAVRQGIADADAGHLLTFEEVVAGQRAFAQSRGITLPASWPNG